jgi:hypothetical protein
VNEEALAHWGGAVAPKETNKQKMFRTNVYFPSNINMFYSGLPTVNQFPLHLFLSSSSSNDLPFQNDLAFIPLSAM